MSFMAEERWREDEGPGLALIVDLAHHHRAVFNQSTGEVRPRCSRIVTKRAVLATVRDVWNKPQPFKATYCARCDRSLAIPPRAVQIFYLRANIMKRLGNMTDEAKARLDANCLEVWRISNGGNEWQERWAVERTFELVGQALNQSHENARRFERTRDPRYLPETVWDIVRPLSENEKRAHSDWRGSTCCDFMPEERARGESAYATVGTLAEVDHA